MLASKPSMATKSASSSSISTPAPEVNLACMYACMYLYSHSQTPKAVSIEVSSESSTDAAVAAATPSVAAGTATKSPTSEEKKRFSASNPFNLFEAEDDDQLFTVCISLQSFGFLIQIIWLGCQRGIHQAARVQGPCR